MTRNKDLLFDNFEIKKVIASRIKGNRVDVKKLCDKLEIDVKRFRDWLNGVANTTTYNQISHEKIIDIAKCLCVDVKVAVVIRDSSGIEKEIKYA